MSRNFPGGTSTHRIEVPMYAAETGLNTFTVAAWTKRDGSGGANLGRICANGDNATLEWAVFHEVVSSVSRLRFSANRWGTTTGVWRGFDSWAANSIAHCAVSYDYGSTANDPVMYKDGLSVTVTETQTPAGTLGGSGAGNFYIGNTSAQNRCWDGNLWDVAVWDRILTPAEVLTVYHGGPMRVLSGLVLYVPVRGDSPEPNYISGASQGAVTGTTVAPERHAGWAPWLPGDALALAGGNAVGGGGTGARSFVAGMIG